MKQGVGFDREVVNRDMGWRQAQDRVQVTGKSIKILAGQCVHQIQVVRVKSLGSLLHRILRLLRVMHTPQCLQVGIVKTLHAHGQTSDAGFAEGAKTVFFKRAWIGL